MDLGFSYEAAEPMEAKSNGLALIQSIAILQGIAYCAMCFVAGIWFRNDLAWFCSIAAIGSGYLSTTLALAKQYVPANAFTAISIALGFMALVSLLAMVAHL